MNVDFEEMISRLKDPAQREEFIMKLENAGKNSSPALHVKNAMTELKVKKTPRGIFQKTIIQHTLRFCEAMESFKTFRSVCKVWQDAVETIRFDRQIRIRGIFDVSTKYLALFKKLEIPMNLTNGDQIYPLVLRSCKKLNELRFDVFLIEPERYGTITIFLLLKCFKIHTLLCKSWTFQNL
jgi:hypothetical protein